MFLMIVCVVKRQLEARVENNGAIGLLERKARRRCVVSFVLPFRSLYRF